MKVGIIGGGFTGLSLAYFFSRDNHSVDLFEKTSSPGGLAGGFKKGNWDWHIDNFYHHVFKSDKSIIKLAQEIEHPIIFTRPKTSTFIKGFIYQIDSAISLLKFEKIPFFDRLRTGFVIFLIKVFPYKKLLERFSAETFIKRCMGDNSWKIIWKPLMLKKFGENYHNISASWFWARIKTRTAFLGYPRGGFQSLALSLQENLKKRGVKFFLNSKVAKISKSDNSINIFFNKDNKENYDIVINTLSFATQIKMVENFPKKHLKNINRLECLSANNLILELNNKYFTDNTYWLNVDETKFPFLCLVEHTNFVKKDNYGGNHILYVGSYFNRKDQTFKLSKEALFNKYYPFLKVIKPDFTKRTIIKTYLNKAEFAQPVFNKNYSETIEGLDNPIENLWSANIQQIYPWDRGTNYSVKIAEDMYKKIQKKYLLKIVFNNALTRLVNFYIEKTKANRYFREKHVKETIQLYERNGLTKLFAKIRFWDAPLHEIDEIVPKKGKIIDLGCGEGILTNYLALKSKQRELFGIEIDKQRISIADKKISNVKFIEGNILKFKIPKCDNITISNVLHHLPSFNDQEKLLLLCKKSLNKKGSVVIADINKSFSLKYLLGWFVDAIVFPFLFEKKIINLNFFHRSVKEWTKLLIGMGFKVKVYKCESFRPFPDFIIKGVN